MINILFIGDIIGEEGLDLALDLIPRLRRDFDLHFCIVNGENIRNGKGLSPNSANRLLTAKVDVITTGNHIWDGKQDASLFANFDNIIRPANYPDLNPGKGFVTRKIQGTQKITVINVQGRSFMNPIDCPFSAVDRILSEIGRDLQICIVDMHAESTAEKQALGWYLDGRVSAVIGTHTHVQTADERVLPNGTGYITDVGMTGPFSSVIGMDTNTAIKRFRYQIPFYYKLAKGNLRLNGLILTLDKNFKTSKIERLNFSKAEYNGR